MANGKAHGQSVRVPVTGEKEKLEDKYAGVPDGRRTPKDGQKLLAEEELNLEEQKSAKENGEGERQLSRIAGIGIRRRGCRQIERGIFRMQEEVFGKEIHTAQV